MPHSVKDTEFLAQLLNMVKEPQCGWKCYRKGTLMDKLRWIETKITEHLRAN